MKLVVCYPHVAPYMAACWRAFAGREDVSLFVLGFRPGAMGYPAPFEERMLQGLHYRLLEEREITDGGLVAEIVSREAPDVVMVSGWAHGAYRGLRRVRTLSHVPFVLVMDNQWKLSWRQLAGKYLLRPYLRGMAAAYVTGERSWHFARYLGFPARQIRKGCCGIDFASLHAIFQSRATASLEWPRSFLYLGRYQELKGFDLLLAGYRLYRQRSKEPWSLTCAGTGPLSSLAQGAEGVTDLGFVQPDKVPALYLNAGALVMAGRYDAWPLTLVEGAASGLPILCSDACGSAVEVVRSHFNGLVFDTGSVEAVARSMSWMEENVAKAPVMGSRSNALAAPYSAEMWSERTYALIQTLVGKQARPGAEVRDVGDPTRGSRPR